MHPIKLHSFEGPLDLLLQLIEEQKLPITEVALAHVTEQYSQHIAQGAIPKEEIADFLVIAAKLLLMKSKTLLPELSQEEVEEGMSLVEQLKIYKLYHDKVPVIERLWNAPAISYARPKMPASWQALFRPPETLTLNQLAICMEQVIAKIVPPQKIFKQLVERIVTVQEKITHILNRLKSSIKLRFSSLLSSNNRSEAIVSFLALLELTKQQAVTAQQQGLFGEIEVRRMAKYEAGTFAQH